MRRSTLRSAAAALVLAGTSFTSFVACHPSNDDDADASAPDGSTDAANDRDADADAAETSVTGTLTLVAGSIGGEGELDGIGDGARLQSAATWLNAAGTVLYVSGYGTIRAVDLATGAVTTVAGTPIPPARVPSTASKDGPRGVGVAYPFIDQLTGGSDSTLLAADAIGVRKVDLDSGTLSTLLDASAFATYDGGFVQERAERLAFDEVANVLWVRSNCSVRAFQLNNLAAPTVWGDPHACGATDGSISVARFGGAFSSGIAVDSTTHRLYLLESNVLRVIDPGIGMVSSVTLSRQSMTWLSFSKATGKLYGTYAPSAPVTTQVAEIDPVTGTVKVLAGGAPMQIDGVGTSAGYLGPFGGAYSSATKKLEINDITAIRELDLAGKVTTTIGGLFSQYGATDGVGPLARFKAPLGVAVDPVTGTAWVTDRENLTLRKIALSTRTVTTVAGYEGAPGSNDGPYLTSQFRAPTGIALDAAGDRVFVADSANAAIRAFDRTTGILSTFVGDPAVPGIVDGPKVKAKLSVPRDLAFDAPSGVLYFTDECRIRRVDTKTTEVKTLVPQSCGADLVDGPSGVAQFVEPRGLAFDAKTASLYILDRVSQLGDDSRRVIRRLDLGTGVTSTFLSGPALVDPYVIVADPAKASLLVGDYSTVLRVAIPSAAVTTVFGAPTRWGVRVGPLSQASFFSIGGMALVGTNDMVLTDGQGAVLRATGW